MSSDVAIANLALQAIGTRSTIASFGEGSNESNAINPLWAPVRAEYRAKTKKPAAATSTTTDPTACASVIVDNPIRWRVGPCESGVDPSDASTLEAVYNPHAGCTDIGQGHDACGKVAIKEERGG